MMLFEPSIASDFSASEHGSVVNHEGSVTGAALPDIKLDERLRRVAVNQVSLNTCFQRIFFIYVVTVLLRGAD